MIVISAFPTLIKIFSKYSSILHNLKRKIKFFNSLPPLLYSFLFHYFSFRVFILIIIRIVFVKLYFFSQIIFLVILLIFFFSFIAYFKSISYYATMIGIVGPILYFRWPIKSPPSDRLVPSSIRTEFGLMVERCLYNPIPVIRDLCFAPSCVVGT